MFSSINVLIEIISSEDKSFSSSRFAKFILQYLKEFHSHNHPVVEKIQKLFG